MTQLPEERDSARVIGEPRGRRPADTFSVRLLLARHLNGMTISEAATACGLKDGAWGTWEAGRRPRDILDVCSRVADALDIDHHWLLFGGPLAGPRGVPTKRAVEDNHRYPVVDVRPTDTRPDSRPPRGPNDSRPAARTAAGPVKDQPARGEPRRAVLISQLHVA